MNMIKGLFYFIKMYPQTAFLILGIALLGIVGIRMTARVTESIYDNCKQNKWLKLCYEAVAVLAGIIITLAIMLGIVYLAAWLAFPK